MAETAHADTTHGAAEAASGGLPQLDFSTWGGQIFWLVVSFALLYFVVSRFILPKLGQPIAERSDRIADDLDAAARMQRESEQALKTYEGELADARAKAHTIAATTRSSVEAEIASELDTADAEMARHQAAADARITAIHNDALRNVDGIAADAVSEIIAKLTGKPASLATVKSALAKG